MAAAVKWRKDKKELGVLMVVAVMMSLRVVLIA
jgi:hypothetical protein